MVVCLCVVVVLACPVAVLCVVDWFDQCVVYVFVMCVRVWLHYFVWFVLKCVGC